MEFGLENGGWGEVRVGGQKVWGSRPMSLPATGLLKTSEFAKTSPACLPAT